MGVVGRLPTLRLCCRMRLPCRRNVKPFIRRAIGRALDPGPTCCQCWAVESTSFSATFAASPGRWSSCGYLFFFSITFLLLYREIRQSRKRVVGLPPDTSWSMTVGRPSWLLWSDESVSVLLVCVFFWQTFFFSGVFCPHKPDMQPGSSDLRW